MVIYDRGVLDVAAFLPRELWGGHCTSGRILTLTPTRTLSPTLSLTLGLILSLTLTLTLTLQP